jgi:hypothetical protein
MHAIIVSQSAMLLVKCQLTGSWSKDCYVSTQVEQVDSRYRSISLTYDEGQPAINP